jgi:hypothetical protein
MPAHDGHGADPGGAGHEGDPLVVVTASESVAAVLAGREGLTYVSPPQRREQALTLVRLLTGCAEELANGRRRWAVPIAGGRLVVALREEARR